MSLVHEDQPVIVSATFLSVPGMLRIFFDIPMLDIEYDPSNIFFRYGNFRKECDVWNFASPTQILMQIVRSIADPGPNITSFTGAEMDLFSVDLIPCAFWTDFPTDRLP